jgi:hypothetical protein
VHTESASFSSTGDSAGFIIRDSIGSSVIAISWNTVSWSANISSTAEMLSSEVSGGGLGFVLDPRPEIVHARIQGIFTSILQNNLAGNLGISTATVLVGPLNGQDTTRVIVHALVLGESGGVTGRGIDRFKTSSTIFSLESLITYTTLASIATIVIVLTENCSKS